jgi:hypothetical protein
MYYRRLIELQQPILHQQSTEAVYKSYSQGCDICRRLWNQLTVYCDRYEKDIERCRLSSVYVVNPVLDQVKTIPGHSETDPYDETLSSSGLEYSIEFRWRDQAWPYWIESAFPEYHVVAAESMASIYKNASDARLILH